MRNQMIVFKFQMIKGAGSLSTVKVYGKGWLKVLSVLLGVKKPQIMDESEFEE